MREDDYNSSSRHTPENLMGYYHHRDPLEPIDPQAEQVRVSLPEPGRAHGAYGSSYRGGGASGFYEPRGRGNTGLIIGLTSLALIILIALTAGFFGWRERESEASLSDSGSYNWDFGDIPAPDWILPEEDNNGEVEQSREITIPKAKTGTGVTLSVNASRGAELTLPEIYERCAPSVVALSAEAPDGVYWGTGILFTPDGYIVTNCHIIEGTSAVTVTLSDNREYEGRLVGADTRSDLAVLKINAEGLPYAEFGDSSQLRVGESVVAIGNPLGEEFRSTMTDGIVSAIDRDVEYSGFVMSLIQTNAALNEGNSGGPLLNMYGQVVGITNMKMMSYYSSIEGIGFAIPSVSIKEVADELISKGKISRPAIGIIVREFLAEELELYPAGVYIESVIDGSDAKRKGLQTGDIITEVDGVPVTTNDAVRDAMAGKEPGDKLKLTIYRNGEYGEYEIKLGDMFELFGY